MADLGSFANISIYGMKNGLDAVGTGHPVPAFGAAGQHPQPASGKEHLMTDLYPVQVSTDCRNAGTCLIQDKNILPLKLTGIGVKSGISASGGFQKQLHLGQAAIGQGHIEGTALGLEIEALVAETDHVLVGVKLYGALSIGEDR